MKKKRKYYFIKIPIPFVIEKFLRKFSRWKRRNFYKKCYHCRAEILKTDNFCERCGRKNPQTRVEELIYEIPKETVEWIESVGGRRYHEPMVYYLWINNTSMNYDAEYLKNTPLNKLKEEHEKSIKTLP